MTGERRTWEYRSVGAADPSLDLDALGQDGWELVAGLSVDGRPTLYFKRPGPDFRERVTLDQKRAVYVGFGLSAPEPDGGRP